LLLPTASAGYTYLLATTIFHAGVVTGQIGNAIACRSEKSYLHQLGWFSNPLLLAGIAVEIILILMMIYLPPLARLFGHVPLPGENVVVDGDLKKGEMRFESKGANVARGQAPG